MDQTNKQNKQIETGFLITLKEIKSKFISGTEYKDFKIINKLEVLK